MVQKAKGAKASRASVCNANEIKKKTFEMNFQSNLGARCRAKERRNVKHKKCGKEGVPKLCQIQEQLKLPGHGINLYPWFSAHSGRS